MTRAAIGYGGVGSSTRVFAAGRMLVMYLRHLLPYMRHPGEYLVVEDPLRRLKNLLRVLSPSGGGATITVVYRVPGYDVTWYPFRRSNIKYVYLKLKQNKTVEGGRIIKDRTLLTGTPLGADYSHQLLDWTVLQGAGRSRWPLVEPFNAEPPAPSKTPRKRPPVKPIRTQAPGPRKLDVVVGSHKAKYINNAWDRADQCKNPVLSHPPWDPIDRNNQSFEELLYQNIPENDITAAATKLRDGLLSRENPIDVHKVSGWKPTKQKAFGGDAGFKYGRLKGQIVFAKWYSIKGSAEQKLPEYVDNGLGLPSDTDLQKKMLHGTRMEALLFCIAGRCGSNVVTPLELYQGYDEVRKTYTRYHIYEFFPRGTLEDAVKLKYQHFFDTNPDTGRRNRIETLIGLVSAVSCLHQSGYVHNDVKPQNVMIDEKYKARLCDFESTTAIMDPKDDTDIWDHKYDQAELCPRTYGLLYRSDNISCDEWRLDAYMLYRIVLWFLNATTDTSEFDIPLHIPDPRSTVPLNLSSENSLDLVLRYTGILLEGVDTRSYLECLTTRLETEKLGPSILTLKDEDYATTFLHIR